MCNCDLILTHSSNACIYSGDGNGASESVFQCEDTEEGKDRHKVDTKCMGTISLSLSRTYLGARGILS